MCSERHRRDKTGASGGINDDREPVLLVTCTRYCCRSLLSLLLITFTISLLVIPSQARPLDRRDDTLCNVGGAHECVCNRSAGNLDSLGHQHCDRIFEDKTLPVIRILMRNVNLNARLYTNESYQEYFRRRVANLVSKYCEHQANECPGTSLRLTKVDSSEPQLMDDAEPLIAQENVVILRVGYPDRDRTEVFFVVLKNLTAKTKIGRADVMDHSLVKSVLSVQLAPLSRVLGGIRIEKLEKAEISRKRPPADNTKLITIVCIIAGTMVPCYGLAIYRVCRDYHRKKKAQANLSDKNKRNYGTCTDKFLPICEVPNGKPKAKSITSDGSVKSKKSRTNAVNQQMEVTAIETEPLQERDEPAAYQRMFICDPSQLPDESILLEEVEPGESIGSPSDNIEADDTSEPSPSALPSVVLVQSNSHVEITPEKNNNKQQSGSTFLGSVNNVPYERPLSRRGSRVSTPEQGEEEYTETREDTPQPLGDDVFDSPKEVPAVTIAINDTAVAKSSTAHKFSHWSSDSEPEPNEVYQKLDESDEDVVLPKTEKKKARTKKASDRTRERSLHSESSESEEEDVLDRHQYERLQESPLPPTTVKEPPIALDSTLQYNHDSLNHSDLDLK